MIVLGGHSVAAADEELQKFEFLQIRMGIPVSIQLYAAGEEVANTAAKAAYERIRAIDRMMSDYDPDSELMQLCRNARPGVPHPVSAELAYVLARARDLSERTGGRFDVTIGPVVHLWRKARRREEMPDASALEEALARVGFRSVIVDEEGRTVTFTQPDMRLDLGAIAKGYAADEALRILREHGLPRALVDAGGDVVVGDAPPGRSGWRIEMEGIRDPEKERSDPRVLLLTNSAVATSGDAYRFVEIDGVRYSHIVDPETGLGLTTRSSVTVIAPDCMTADSLATAVSVLGPDAGVRLVNCTCDAEVDLIVAEECGFREVTSRGFARYLLENQRERGAPCQGTVDRTRKRIVPQRNPAGLVLP